MTDATNRKAADQLHEIRQRINKLRDQEQELRRGFISGDLPLEGDAFTVIIDRKATERVDLALMRERLPEEVWRPFLISTPSTYVNLRRKQ